MADAAQQTASVPRAFYRQVMDARSGAGRFAKSRFVARLWPEALRERTLDYFEWQHRIDEGFLTLGVLAATLDDRPVRARRRPHPHPAPHARPVVDRHRAPASRPWSPASRPGAERLEELLGLGALADSRLFGRGRRVRACPGRRERLPPGVRPRARRPPGGGERPRRRDPRAARAGLPTRPSGPGSTPASDPGVRGLRRPLRRRRWATRLRAALGRPEPRQDGERATG